LKKLQSSEEEIDVQDSLHKIVTSEDDVDDYNTIVPELKLSIFEHLDEFQIEIESRYKEKSCHIVCGLLANTFYRPLLSALGSTCSQPVFTMAYDL